jgi:hypothetical protein
MSMSIRYQAFSLEFPQELCNHIFETLQNDSLSLKRCSLVCKAWLHATRTHLFRQVILTPKNINPFTYLIIDSRSTVHSHVRNLELRRINYLNRWIISNFTPTLTHLHMRDITFNAFADILDIICSFPYLQSVTLDESTVESSSVEKSARIQDKVLPPFVNSVRCRGGRRCLRAFLMWLLHHNIVPKLSSLDVGPIEEESNFEVGKYLASVGPAINHLSISFDFSHNSPICAHHDPPILLTSEYAKPNVSSIAERYKALFGLDICHSLGSLTGLQSLRLNNFIHFEDHTRASSLIWAPRMVASIRAMELREVILGISLRRAGELDKFNIHWDYFDEVFSSIMDGPYSNLDSVKFVINGTVNMDGIAGLIRSRLPGCEKRGLLQFCRERVH